VKIKKNVARHLFLPVTLNNKKSVERGCYFSILKSLTRKTLDGRRAFLWFFLLAAQKKVHIKKLF